MRNQARQPQTCTTGRTEKKRVSCFDTEINGAEFTLLSKGWTFVPTHEKLTRDELRSVECAMERTANSLRWKYAKDKRAGGDDDDQNEGVDDQNEGNDDQNEGGDEDGNGASVEEREGVVSGQGEEKEDGQERDAEEDEAGKNEMPSLLTEPKVRKLAKKIQRTTQAPRMDVEKEFRTSEVKMNITKAYQQYRPGRRNISAAEKSAIGTLRQNSKDREAIIKCSDKSKSLVVLKRTLT